MEGPLPLLGGHVLMAIGTYLLSKAISWDVALGFWVLVQGAAILGACLVAQFRRDDDGKPWHAGAID